MNSEKLKNLKAKLRKDREEAFTRNEERKIAKKDEIKENIIRKRLKQKQGEDIKKRVQKHRAKMTPEQLDEKRRKDRERYRAKKQKGLTKSITELSPKKQKQKRKEWKSASLRYRRNKILKQKTQSFIKENSPPTSEDEDDVPNVNYLETNEIAEDERPNIKVNSAKKAIGRQKVRRDRSSCYRKLKEAEKQILELKKMVGRYKKQIQRKNLNNKKKTKTGTGADSPQTRVNQLTSHIEIPSSIKKRLVFGEVLKDQLTENINEIKNQKGKDAFTKVISGKILKKYRMVGQANKLISYKMHRKQMCNLKLTQYERKKRNNIISQDLRKSVQEFLEKDENSKMCPGKKDFVVNGKLKKQKRIILDTFKTLHKKYLESEVRHKISLATFWRYRPFWVVLPKQSDRETCACIKHANMEFICTKMYNAKLINAKHPDDILKYLVCNEKNIDCMLRRCSSCKGKMCSLTGDASVLNDKIVYKQWETKAENKVIKGQNKVIRRTVKSEKTVKVRELLNILNKKIIEYMKHVFFVRHQQRELYKKRNSIEPNEIIIQIDFSENYVAKYDTEIQSMHFGASKKQISLHTGIYYYREKVDSPVKSQCFCSVSDNLDHQSHAVWAHLDGILSDLAVIFPHLSRLQFVSDGPTSQYKNRNNCFFLINKVPQYFKNIQELSWNFSESGHGKGPMDGVGGCLKRKADRLVFRGTDITCAKDFVKKLGTDDSSIKLWNVNSEKIELLKKELLRQNVTQVPNIMSAHQLTWSKETDKQLFLRSLSCFSCQFDQQCQHYSLKPAAVTILDRNKIFSYLILSESLVNCSTKHQEMSKAEEKLPICDSLPIVPVPPPRISAFPKINIISDVTILSFPKNKKLERGLCFACTLQFNVHVQGIKCLNCRRAYHHKCIFNHKLCSPETHTFVCATCIKKTV